MLLFQTTIAASHPVKVKGLVNIVDSLRAEVAEVHVVYVLPSTTPLYERWQTLTVSQIKSGQGKPRPGVDLRPGTGAEAAAANVELANPAVGLPAFVALLPTCLRSIRQWACVAAV